MRRAARFLPEALGDRLKPSAAECQRRHEAIASVSAIVLNRMN